MKTASELGGISVFVKLIVVILSPACKGFSNVMNANWNKMCDDHVKYVQDTCLAMWLFSIQVAIHQDNHGRFYVLESHFGASFWTLETTQTLHSRPGCELLRVDQCMFGLIVDPTGELLNQKGSVFSTNMPRLKEALRCRYLYNGLHQQWVLNDAKSTRASRVYPKKFQQLVAREIRATINDHRQDPRVCEERRRHSRFEVNPHELIYNRGATGVSLSYHIEIGIEDDIPLSDDEEEAVDEGEPEAVDEGEPEPVQGDQAEGEEVRRNDEAASKTIRRVIKVVIKDVTDRQKYLVKQVHRHIRASPQGGSHSIVQE